MNKKYKGKSMKTRQLKGQTNTLFIKLHFLQ